MKKVVLLLTIVTLFTFSTSVFATGDDLGNSEDPNISCTPTDPTISPEEPTVSPEDPTVSPENPTEQSTSCEPTEEPNITNNTTNTTNSNSNNTTNSNSNNITTITNNTYIKNIKCITNNVNIKKVEINFNNNFKYEKTNNFKSVYYNGQKVLKLNKKNINADISLFGKFGKATCKAKKFILIKGYNKIKHEVVINNKKYVLDLLLYSHINNATFNVNTNTYNYKYINKSSSKNNSDTIKTSNEVEEVETTTTNVTTEGKLLPSNAANKEYNVSTVNATSLPKTGDEVPVLPFVLGSIVLLGGVSLLLKKVLIN